MRHLAYGSPYLQPTDALKLTEVLSSRLRRLVAIRSHRANDLSPEGIRLLDRAIYCTYCDLRDVGLEQHARRLIRQEAPSRSPLGGSPAD